MKKITFIVLLITIVVVFRKFLLPGPLVWGDAPYFYLSGFKELLSPPTLWISRGNSLGGMNMFIWIYPLMQLYGVLGAILNLSNDLVLRVLFYFPSLVFGSLGVYFFTKYFKFSNIVRFFAILIYLVNTYFLLLVDGGQVGVVLAYGLFPLVLLLITRVIDKGKVINFALALIACLFLTVVDFRISAICLFTGALLNLGKPKKLLMLVLLLVCLLALSAYWMFPIVNLGFGGISTSVSDLKLTSLLNSLFLFSPNWPLNQFGASQAPYFYFSVVPILIFTPLFLTREKKVIFYTFLFLIFAFLVKGGSDPFGFIYTFFVNTKLGSVFRDSTKFFIPLVLLGGILIGKTVEIVKNKYITVLLFIFILFLSWQAIFGKLNGVLGKNPALSDYQKIYNLISKEDGFSRSAWFTEKSPFAFHTETKQALDAKDLVNFRPIAMMNTGTGDRFNFINNKNYLDWFDLFGIKYLIFNGNPRIENLNKSDREDWDRLMSLVSNDNNLKKLNLDTSFPVYENQNIHPNTFFVDKTFIVVGGDEIYRKFKDMNNNFSVGNQGFLFLEDGKFNPLDLQQISSSSAYLVFDNKTQDDLRMSFLQKYFISSLKATKSEWAMYKPEDYLKYKFELLIRGVNFNDFDYGLGIAFSTKIGEKINFSLNIPEDGNYILAVRSMDKDNQSMHWDYQNVNNLKKGDFSYVYENKKGLGVLNLVALIPVGEMKTASQLANNFLGFFPHYDVSNDSDLAKIKEIITTAHWSTIDDLSVNKPGWIIYTDSYDSNWSIRSRAGIMSSSFPMYSAINSFWVDSKWTGLDMHFKGNDYLRWGIYFSILSSLLIVTFFLWILSKGK